MRKDVERREAIRLREAGLSINAIARKLCVSKSSVSVWVRNVPVPEQFTSEYRMRVREERRLSSKKVLRKRRILSGDGRWMIRVPNGYKGRSYIGGRYIYEHRYLIEKKIGRLLNSGEVVHHKDGNKLNNDLSNLCIKDAKEHTAEHQESAETISLKCSYCGDSFDKLLRYVRMRRNKGQRNFYCSRTCGGKSRKRSPVA